MPATVSLSRAHVQSTDAYCEVQPRHPTDTRRCQCPPAHHLLNIFSSHPSSPPALKPPISGNSGAGLWFSFNLFALSRVSGLDFGVWSSATASSIAVSFPSPFSMNSPLLRLNQLPLLVRVVRGRGVAVLDAGEDGRLRLLL